LHRPPKLLLPSTPFRRMMLIGAFFVAATTLYQCLSSPRSVDPSNVAEVVNELFPGKKDQFYSLGDTGAELRHGNVILSIAFSNDWSIRTDGKQKILTHKDKSSICHSHVIPVAEYNQMVQEYETLGRALRTMMQEAMKLAAPPGAEVSARVTKLFEEAGPPLRIGNRVIGSMTLGERTARQVQISVWTVNADNAANLNCARVNADASEMSLLEEMARAYRFKSAGN